MTVEGATVVRIIEPSRERQLEDEVNNLHAKLELKQAELEAAYAQLAANGAPADVPEDVVCVGGGLIGEAQGWLWLVRDGQVRRLWPASVEETKHGAAIRAQVARELEQKSAARRSMAS
jgi:hypothetical protein